ncbi:MAG TPA: hypothetical protein VMC42_02055 [Methanoregulaceae archaeon]|nr:hypothetical protein [Methanoregulaceae archaeon]
MVTATEMKTLVERWKRGMRPLKIDDQHYGTKVVRMLEHYKGPELAYFDDPLEAATFIILIGLLKEKTRAREGFDP